jgi:hypothetical protein
MRKAIGMFAVLMFALTASGVAYACWSKTIYIEGIVNTGTLCVGWENAWTDDPDDTIDPWKDKHVGRSEVELEGPKGEHGENICYENLVITIDNVYPYYETTVYAVVANCGTIPVVVDNCSVTVTSDPDNLEPFLYVYCWIVDYPENFWPDTQIDPCDTVTIACDLHVLQDVDNRECPMNATLEFEAELSFVQWNCEDIEPND